MTKFERINFFLYFCDHIFLAPYFTLLHNFSGFFCSVPFNCEKPIENRFFLGHSYVVYGPLVNGGTTLLFESTPTYPDPGRYWETVERLKIQHFYGSPTALRLLIRQETTQLIGNLDYNKNY